MKNYGYNSFNVGSGSSSSNGGMSLLKVLLGTAIVLILGWLAVRFLFPKKVKYKRDEQGRIVEG